MSQSRKPPGSAIPDEWDNKSTDPIVMADQLRSLSERAFRAGFNRSSCLMEMSALIVEMERDLLKTQR